MVFATVRGVKKNQKLRIIFTGLNFFVHDGINSVADYNSLRVDVGCLSDVWISPGKFLNGITFKRLEVLN